MLHSDYLISVIFRYFEGKYIRFSNIVYVNSGLLHHFKNNEKLSKKDELSDKIVLPIIEKSFGTSNI